MISSQAQRNLTMTVALVLSASVVGGAPAIAAEPQAVEPKAETLFKQTADYLGKLAAFTLQATVVEERMLNTGLKLMFHRDVALAINRPNRFHASRNGAIVEQDIVYDGKQLGVHGKRAGVYATADAPATIDETLTFAVDALGAHLPGADLLYTDIYSGLMEDVESGHYVGLVPVNRANCHHLVFRSAEVDWQIWVKDGDEPLPCKYVVTSKWTTGAPEFIVTFNQWNIAPEFTADEFRLQVPKDAERVELKPSALMPK